MVLRQVDNRGDVEISAQRALVLANKVRFVRVGPEKAQGVLVGVHGDRVEPQVEARAEYSDRDLAAVCREDFNNFMLGYDKRLQWKWRDIDTKIAI